MSIIRTAPWTVLWLAAACLSGCSTRPTRTNPYSPKYGHEYRHGAMPTPQAAEKIRAYQSSMRGAQAAPAATTLLTFGGGIDGIGVTSGRPGVYLVFYGSQWAKDRGGDPNGVSTFLQALFAGIGTGGETWSGTMTQYCDGPMVSIGATSCDPATTPHVGYPSGGALVGVWFDTSAASPRNATSIQLAQEAVKAAAHFGNTTPESNRHALYFIVSPTGTHPDGFNTRGVSFCGWHDFTRSPYGDLAYTNLPYVSDAGTGCGVNFVNSGRFGAFDAFSIVSGHEYAETLTDQNPPGGWSTPDTGEEAADACEWISSGQGAAANVATATGVFAMQGIWSNDANRCEISHAILPNPELPGGRD